MKYYDIKEAQKLAVQNNGFVLGEHDAGRKHFEKFELGVKGKGKSKKARLQNAEAASAVELMFTSDEALVVDPESISTEK